MQQGPSPAMPVDPARSTSAAPYAVPPADSGPPSPPPGPAASSPTAPGALRQNLQWALGAGFALLLLGMLVQTMDTVSELADEDEFDGWGRFWGATFQQYGVLAVSATLIFGGAAGRELPTGTRVIMVLVGALGLASVTAWASAMPWRYASM